MRHLAAPARTLLVALLALAATFVPSLELAAAEAAATQRTVASHLVVVPNSPQGRVAVAQSSARTVARYGAFTLVEATGAEVLRLVAAGGEVRDDMREVRIGTKTFDPKLERPSLLGKHGAVLAKVGRGDTGLAVVQYVGPLKDSWIRAVRGTGVQVVTYMAQNGQLVSGDHAALSALADLSTRRAFIRAVTPYTAADKLLPGLSKAGRTQVVVSTVAAKAGEPARAAVRSVSVRLGAEVPVAGFVHQRVELDAAEIGRLAELGGVVAIERFVAPELLDERGSRIVDGALNGSFQPILGSGHEDFLLANGFTNSSPVIIDITDEGVDRGVVPVPAGSHPDFYRRGDTTAPSRIVYAQEATAADFDARDCGGHGTNVASIATGYNDGTGAAFEDAQGFNYGVGMQPFGKLGATKIFSCAGNFDVTTSLTALHSAAYANGARISNNSWGAPVGGAYNAQAQEFDALVRDVQPSVAGLQGFTEVVAAGNSGSGANSIGSPGTGKNVITVGASEGVRPIGGSDGCGVTDAGSDNARDVIDFSSRGPTDDGRMKPDIVAPGTHVSGAQPQTGAAYSGTGTCNPQFPAGSTLYSLVSGTSQAAPVVTGLASLVRTWFLDELGGGTKYPSPAMTKAILVNTASNLQGGADGAGGINGPIPTQVQGWGRVNLATILNGAARQAVDQSILLTTTGSSRARYHNIASTTRPLKVTLAWTDAPGPTTGNAFVNDLDLVVTAGGVTYKGNVFSGGRSVAGGVADPRNNVENVFLPAGVNGRIKVSVVAKNLGGDGVPGRGDTTDQDYALFISNVGPAIASTAVLADAGRTVVPAGDMDNFLEPGEPFTLAQKLRNVGNQTATSIAGTATAPASDATVTQPSSTWPNLPAGATGTGSPPFGATVKPSIACGDFVDLAITVTSSSGGTTIPVSLRTGRPGGGLTTTSSTDVPKSIPDNDSAGVLSNNVVSGSGILSDLDVTIGSLTHTFVGDLTIDLISPAGTKVRLFNQHGGSGQNFSNTVFNDEAATAISSATAPFTGSFRPFEPLTAFDGQQVNGTWKLHVVDHALQDAGSLNSWSHTRRVYVCS